MTASQNSANPESNSAITAASRLGLLFVIFFLIAAGMGYPVLNRFDPRQTPGLSDVQTYASMVEGNTHPDDSPRRFRVLVPLMSKPVYRLAQGRIGSWDPVLFSLLTIESLFVAATALLIVVLGKRQLESSVVGLLGAFIYLTDFAIPNLRVVGLVEAGEGCFLLALLWSLVEPVWWPLPLIGVLGTLTRETFLPFLITFTAVWWFTAGRDRNRRWLDPDVGMAWIGISWVASVAAFMLSHRAVAGVFINPVEFGLSLHRSQNYFLHFAESLTDRQFWYIFIWLLPTAIPKLKRFPKSWLLATGATCLTAFALDAFHGPATPGAVGRAVFSIAGPLLSLSSAMLLLRMF